VSPHDRKKRIKARGNSSYRAAVVIHGARDSRYHEEDVVGEGRYVEWGSITKCVTASGILAAGEERLLDLDAPVRSVVPRLARTDCTIRELLRHEGGLLRVPLAMLVRPRRDPYAPVAGRALPERWARPLGERGRYLYSNTGYAVLGEVLDAVTGSWWDWCRQRVLVPRGVPGGTLCPSGRPLAVGLDRRGRPRPPWALSCGPFAPAGGIWSSFAELVEFATSWDEPTPPGWSRRDGIQAVNGATRDSRACIVRSWSQQVTVVVHSLRLGEETDGLALSLLREACREA